MNIHRIAIQLNGPQPSFYTLLYFFQLLLTKFERNIKKSIEMKNGCIAFGTILFNIQEVVNVWM